MRRFALVVLGLGLVACQRDASLDGPAPTTSAQLAAAPAVAAAAPAPAPAGDLVEGRVEKPTRDTREAQQERERRIADARRAVDVTIYGASWCPSCKQARAWLDAQGMAYRDLDVDRSEEANRAAHRLNPAGTIPVIDVEGDVLVGFAPDALDRTIRRKAERKVN